jgi:protein gp37
MATETLIQWTDHTFNPWRGCTKVSPGCTNCYAEKTSKRNPSVLGVWGPHGTRPAAAESYWREPLAWDRQAEQEGRRHRVFCASLADVFEDRQELVKPRQRLFDLIGRTPNLDWQLLTKRPGNLPDMVPDSWIVDGCPDNVWMMTSVEDQDYANCRIPELLRIPARVRGLSVEPLLGRVDLIPWLDTGCIHWLIIGGESGPRARPCRLEWIETLVDQCARAAVPCFVKQIGALPLGRRNGQLYVLHPKHSKGGEPEEWPESLRVREFPEPLSPPQ